MEISFVAPLDEVERAEAEKWADAHDAEPITSITVDTGAVAVWIRDRVGVDGVSGVAIRSPAGSLTAALDEALYNARRNLVHREP